MLGILSHKMLKGCSTIKTPEDLQYFQNNCLEVMSLQDMLNTKFRTDAHFVTYQIPSFPLWPRLNKPILPEIRAEGLDIVLTHFAFDWDNPEHSDWTESSLTAFAEKISSCTDPIISKWAALYTTQHGARFIYRLSSPIPVDTAEHHLTWMIHHMQEQGFTNIDGSCKDWPRCFRSPQVVRDGNNTWEQCYYSCISQENVLDISLLGKMSPETIARKTYFSREKLELPGFEVLENLLNTLNPATSKLIQTDFLKKAKKHLKNSPYFDVLFNKTSPGWLKGQRNNEILKMLGIVTPLLLKGCYASIQQIFALAVNPLLTLELDIGQDPKHWVLHGWNALIDIYEREVNKFNIEKEEVAKERSKEIIILDSMVEGMKQWNIHPDLYKDEETAREFVRHNMLATVGNFFFLLNEDGYYEQFSVVTNQVISRIRKTFRDILIPTKKISNTGEDADVSVTQLQNEFSTPVAEIVMKPVGDRGGFIENMNGEKPTLVLSTFSRNDKLEPVFNEFVDAWLQNLFGYEYEKGIAWIGNALAFEEGLICALSLEGASNAGKKLLTQGLAECLKEPCIAGPMDIYGMSSAFLKTPFLMVNEAWPNQKYNGVSPADTFKALTGGDGIRVKEIYKPSVTILCPLRILLTANDDGIVRTLTQGKDMTFENRIAIGERLFHVKVSNKAMWFLKSIGGMEFTGKPGQRWIRPDSGSEPSDFVVAKHFLWLYHNRDKVDGSQRFLVMGNSAPGAGGDNMTIFEKLLADNNCTPLVAQAIVEMLDKQGQIWKQFLRTNNEMTRLWVTRNGVHKYIKEILEERVQERDVFSGMLNLLLKNDPDEYDGMHWYEVSVEVLSMIATERGIGGAKSYIKTMHLNKLSKQGQKAGV
jgi:hypothetical protein